MKWIKKIIKKIKEIITKRKNRQKEIEIAIATASEMIEKINILYEKLKEKVGDKNE